MKSPHMITSKFLELYALHKVKRARISVLLEKRSVFLWVIIFGKKHGGYLI